MAKNTDFVKGLEQVTQNQSARYERLKFYNANTSVNTKNLPKEGDIFVEAGGTVTFLREEKDGSWSSAFIHATEGKDLEIKLSALVFTPDNES